MQPKDLTELDRLQYVVLAIENDCAIVPVGSMKMTPNHQLRRNEAFKGLGFQDGVDMKNYVHFRNVQGETYKQQLDEPGAPFKQRFLEPIAEDLPKGAWSVQRNPNGWNVIIRSRAWNGFTFYHHVGTKKFGSIYIGEGLKNDELQFMLQ